jgi:uncharacterized membrane protein
VDHATLTLAALATVLSAIFFVGGKVVMARFRMPWDGVWAWTLVTSGACGLAAWLACGAGPVAWAWCLGAGLAGALAHICANLALSWGEASLLVPLSGAKPLVLLALSPLFAGHPLPAALIHASWLATFGIALTGLAPRRVHHHAPRPGVAFLLMALAVVLMALSDLCGNQGVLATTSAGGSRFAAIAAWNMGLGILPLGWLLLRRPRQPPAGVAASIGLGLLFTMFIAAIAVAFAVAPDHANAVASVNVVVACRGVLAVLLVLLADRWLGLGLEPIPRWIHAVRLAGALVLAVAVALAAL